MRRTAANHPSQEWLYHATYSDAVLLVEEYGLIPAPEADRVFLSDSIATQASWATLVNSVDFEEVGQAYDPVLLRVPAASLSKLHHAPGEKGVYYVEHRVLPNQIEAWAPWKNDWLPIEEAADKLYDNYTRYGEPPEALDVQPNASPYQLALAIIRASWPEFGPLPRRNPPERFTEKEMRDAARTSRAWNTSPTEQAVLKAFKEGLISKTSSILDFGAGHHTKWTIRLREAGFKNVTAYDFPEQYSPHDYKSGLHDPGALKRKYDLVFSGNVLNVQTSLPMFNRTVKQIRAATKPNGYFIFNVPSKESPHKAGLDKAGYKREVGKYFSSVKEFAGTPARPIFICTGKKR